MIRNLFVHDIRKKKEGSAARKLQDKVESRIRSTHIISKGLLLATSDLTSKLTMLNKYSNKEQSKEISVLKCMRY